MAPLKQKGDWAELEVARDLVKRGFRIAIPYGEDWDFDLLFQRPGFEAIERVQVKYVTAKKGVLCVRCKSQSLTNGRVRQVKLYTPRMIDWLGVFAPTTGRCYYIPAVELGENGRNVLHLRLEPTRNYQQKGIRYAADYEELKPSAQSSL